MCDYSLHSCATRDAEIGDQLVTTDFDWTTTKGLRRPNDNKQTATCLKQGTEISFDDPLKSERSFQTIRGYRKHRFATATFCELNTNDALAHHDALRFPDGSTVKLNKLVVGQRVTVLQVPAKKREVVITNSETPSQPVSVSYLEVIDV